MNKALVALPMLGVGMLAGVVISAQVQTVLASNAAPFRADVLDEAPGQRGPWLGLALAPMNDKVAAQFNITKQDGLVVMHVMPNSPAAAAGVQAGDVVPAIGGATVKSMADMRTALKDAKVGTPVAFALVRKGAAANISVTPADPPAAPNAGGPRGKGGPGHGGGHGGPGGLGMPFMDDLQGVPRDQVFDHMIGGQFTYKDKDGKTVTTSAVFGKVTTASDNSVTITRNDNAQTATFSIDANTKLRGKGSDLKAGNKVVVSTKNGSTTAAAIANSQGGPRPGGQNKPGGQGGATNPNRMQEFRTFMQDRMQGMGAFHGAPQAMPFPGWGAPTIAQ
ncbi:MAG: PDZ domain-containing protein [Dehalococcoidia bacterium]|nr:PDZ domain-containing protein [Dehalococcoidia bacterium]